MAISISLTVNGAPVTASIDPRTLLVQFLRDQLRLTGTHIGCDTAQCGACTVHLNGRAIKSCNILAVQADGTSITTIEGIAQNGALHPMQAAFKDCHGLQCGFCTPGMVMSAISLVAASARSHRRRRARPARRQSVPLYGLSQHRESGARRRRRHEVSRHGQRPCRRSGRRAGHRLRSRDECTLKPTA